MGKRGYRLYSCHPPAPPLSLSLLLNLLLQGTARHAHTHLLTLLLVRARSEASTSREARDDRQPSIAPRAPSCLLHWGLLPVFRDFDCVQVKSAS
jgi:hypothetical protein